MPSLVDQRVGVLVGSLRAGSFTRQIAKALIDRAPTGLDCRFIEIRSLPAFHLQPQESSPAAWQDLRRSIAGCDALLFVTPDYHAAMPDCLMNAIDVASLVDGHNVLHDKPAAVVSVSPYSLGGFGANEALGATLANHDMLVMRRPRGYVGNVAKVIDAQGAITRKKTHALLTAFMTAFGRWVVAQGRPPVPRGDEFDADAGFFIDGVLAPPRGHDAPTRQASLFPHGT